MKRVGLFFGGMSNEAEVSVLSAKNVAANIDTSRFQLVPIFWDMDGNFRLVRHMDERTGTVISPSDFLETFDVALPMTHEKFGEDGVLQAIFESRHVPYCGCRVLASALCMDKARFKTLLGGQDILQTRFVVIDRSDDIGDVAFPLPFFVKPSNSGSSVGITRVVDIAGLDDAITEARKHDDSVIIEEGLTDFQEIEIAVLGNAALTVSVPGRVKPSQEFYSYDDKYVLDQATFDIPAQLPDGIVEDARRLAERAYRLCGCEGFARVDLFVRDGQVYLNEINTLPGFTDISMYPKLMEATGIPYRDLITRIIELAH
ncbi:MAG: D-alanine--D-alanine ligase family protein [Patescibacteria group bacterium]